jgi:predicted transcriptional regulator
MKKPIPAKKIIASLPAARRKKIRERAEELIATQLALGEIRKARALTQEQVAKKLGGKQVYVSRFENRADVKISTLREFVKAMGGDLQLLVTFPEGDRYEVATGKK